MSNRAKILVMDDELPSAMAIVALLTEAGFVVEGACNGKMAVQKAEEQHFDLIILDVNMPGIGGFQLMAQLKQIPQLAETPVVFVSGCAEHGQRALAVGAVDFIGKPFEGKQLVTCIQEHLERTAMERREKRCTR